MNVFESCIQMVQGKRVKMVRPELLYVNTGVLKVGDTGIVIGAVHSHFQEDGGLFLDHYDLTVHFERLTLQCPMESIEFDI